VTRPPRARESVLDAFERLLIDQGERAATMDAVARSAGVSKGGLLYHFASKDALEAAVVARLQGLVEADVAAIEAAPEGAVAFFLHSSVMDDEALDRAIIATTRLAQGGNPVATTALHDMHERWSSTLRPHVRDQAALDLVLLVSDGLYFNNALGAPTASLVPRGAQLEALITLVEAVSKPTDADPA
jgi:AcrR family transcriptional regulator